jgi:hypothetical protein
VLSRTCRSKPWIRVILSTSKKLTELLKKFLHNTIRMSGISFLASQTRISKLLSDHFPLNSTRHVQWSVKAVKSCRLGITMLISLWILQNSYRSTVQILCMYCPQTRGFGCILILYAQTTLQNIDS